MVRPSGLFGIRINSEIMNPFMHVGTIPWTGYRPMAQPLPTQARKHKNADIIHACAGFEPTIQVFELFQAKLALDRAATATGDNKLQ
jgi:hypothetical protein